MAEPIPRHFFSGPMEFSVRTVPVNPGGGQIEVSEDFVEGLEGEGAIVGDGSGFRVVGPGSGILEIQHLMSQGAESKKILEVVPDHPSKGVLSNQTGDDDSHPRTLKEPGPVDHHPHVCPIGCILSTFLRLGH